MKRGVLLGITVAMAMFVCAGVTRAAQADGGATIRESITLTQESVLGGQRLEAGKYNAEITGGEIVLKRDKKEVARARVKRTELAAPAKYDRVDLRANGSGGKDVAAVHFKGERESYTVLDNDGVAIAEKP
jgi:hypothetical protein